jgi:ParB family chromosome partitioning protein
MAQANEDWAWPLLLEFFGDPDPPLRLEAFAFAIKKNKELEPLEAALGSPHPDLRGRAVGELIRKRTKASQALLVRALADREAEVRLRALEALVNSDARAPLLQALDSPYSDVRVRAARALARHGAEGVLPALLALATAPRPVDKDREAEWVSLSSSALLGIGELGDPAALRAVLPLLDHDRAEVRAAAARALAGLARPDDAEALRPALRHHDPQVKFRAALALALAGDSHVAPIVFSAPAAGVLAPFERLTAAFALGPAAEDQLAAFLDDADEAVRQAAQLLLILPETVTHGGTPDRCLACLSSRMPRVRLTAAEGLGAFARPGAYAEFAAGLFNDRGEAIAWKVPAETVRAVAELLAFAGPQVKARTAALLQNLAEREQAPWNHAWEAHADRFKDELARVAKAAAEKPTPAPAGEPDQWNRLAFGAYVGLVREQGGAGDLVPASTVVRVRQTALSRVLGMAQANPAYAAGARSVLVQALGDPNQPVRVQAFEALQALGMDATTLGAEALEAGHTDLGVKGLELLAGAGSSAEGDRVLEGVMLNRRDELAVEAAKLLRDRQAPVAVARRALAAANEALRRQAVAWLAADYDKDETARDALRSALQSRYPKVREAAALELGFKKDPQVFDALAALLAEAAEAGPQRRILEALVSVGDPRTPGVLLTRLENDPAGTALAEEIVPAVAGFRQPASVERLLAYGEKSGKWGEVYQAILTISGYDQPIEDPEDEDPDRTWQDKQHSRHDAVLARLMEHALQRGATGPLAGWIPHARWARGKEVEPVLAQLTNHSNAGLRQAAVEALGWRLRKRQGSAEPLLKALRHRDPTTQFRAAEGLALGKRPEGVSVLLSAIEYLDDLGLRSLAVAALGKLADRRALDLLLKIASEDGHALQEGAAEALGHFGQSPNAQEIFQLLERYARGEGGLAERALRGMRWLGNREAWQVIRQHAADPHAFLRYAAVELLGYNDEPATRDLLLRLLRQPDDDDSILEDALASARRIWGPDSLEPDYAALCSKAEYGLDDSLERVCKRGEPARMLEILPDCAPEVQEELTTALLGRPSLPAAQLRTGLERPDARSVQLAAHLLGRIVPPPKEAAPSVQLALTKWTAAWDQRRRHTLRVNAEEDDELDRITRCLEMLLWAAGRLGVDAGPLLKAVQAQPDDIAYRPVRYAAALALTERPLTAESVAALEQLAVGNDPPVRALAAEALARRKPERAAAVADRLLADRVSFDRLAAQPAVALDPTLHKAAAQLHYQGVALPHLIRRRDLAGLAAVVDDRKLPEATRLGALEGLAALGDEKAEAKLVAVGTAKDEPKDLRKAAWRGLRRSRRLRKKNH